MIDPFGNYFCQKVIEMASMDQIQTIIQKTNGRVKDIALDPFGTRSIQKLIQKSISMPLYLEPIVYEICESFVELAIDTNGNHVVQECLSSLLNEQRANVYEVIMGNYIEIATEKHGCCVIQRALDYGSEIQTKILLNETLSHLNILINHQYGNYVVKNHCKLASTYHKEQFPFILKNLHNELSPQQIRKALQTEILFKCSRKCNSLHLIQCLKLDNLEFRNSVADKLLANNKYIELITHEFGNYVVQRSIRVVSKERRNALLSVSLSPLTQNISKNSNFIKKNEIGKKVLYKLSTMSHKTSKNNSNCNFN